MSAAVVPFPAARRVALVRSITRRALSLPPVAGEGHIARAVRLQVQVMRRRGIADRLILKDAMKFEAAVRAAMWDAVMQPRETR